MGTEWKANQYITGNYLKTEWIDRFRFIYTEMVAMMPDKITKVLDLGCGVGHLGRELVATYGVIDYLGIDFSSEMIKGAKNYLPDLKFMVGNLKTKRIQKLYTNKHIYVCMETLEHIVDDLEIIKAIPAGSELYFSVPSYDSQNHVRHFDNEDEVIIRYRSLLNFESIKTVFLEPNSGNTNRLYMVKSVRKI